MSAQPTRTIGHRVADRYSALLDTKKAVTNIDLAGIVDDEVRNLHNQPTRTDSAHGPHERSERADPCRDALREIAAWDPAAAPDEPRGMSIMDAIDMAQAALETENPLPALVEALERFIHAAEGGLSVSRYSAAYSLAKAELAKLRKQEATKVEHCRCVSVTGETRRPDGWLYCGRCRGRIGDGAAFSKLREGGRS